MLRVNSEPEVKPQAGQTLAHYRLVEQLGEGGMGVVWKALDTKLDREVAVKILPDIFADDPERLARFDREAKLLAQLNHRNIAAIYGFEEANGYRFLVMELVEGEDLAQRLARGALTVEEALDVAHQLARALEAAHEKGVLHRDLKPANVQVTDEGRVKVLDFGLAKAFEAEPTRTDQGMSPTLTSAGTKAGMILGTAAYMSPEQARGKVLDKRTDIWSFGCVLYECLTGRSAFRGETVSDTMAGILKSDPEWSALPERTPPRVRELLQRCLEKEARNRLRDVGDARLELQRSLAGRESLTDTSAMPVAAVAEAQRGFAPWTLALVALVSAVAGIGLWNIFVGSTVAPGSSAPARVSIQLPGELLVGSGSYLLSPAGDVVAFAGAPRDAADPDAAVSRLYTRRIDSYEIEPVAGTENGVWSSRFSPDGKTLFFVAPVAARSNKGRLSRVPVDGSAPPITVADWSTDWRGGSWLVLPGDEILIVTPLPQSIVRLPTDGGSATEPIPLNFGEREGAFGLPPTHASLLPGGNRIVGSLTVWEERGFESHVALVDMESGAGRILIENGSFPQFSPTGHLVFSRADTLLAVPFDGNLAETTGSPVSKAAGLRATATWADAYFNLASNGTLLHMPGGVIGGDRQLVFFDEDMRELGPWSEDRRAFEGGLSVSPDGRQLAVGVVNDEGLYDIWISDVDRPRLRQLVREAGWDCSPVLWTPDSERLIYVCASAQASRLSVCRADGTGEPELLSETAQPVVYVPTSFLPDGSTAVAIHLKSGTEWDIVLMPLEPLDDSNPPSVLVSNALNGLVAPDGRWLAYQSDRSGRTEIYLRALRSDAALGREIPVTDNGGNSPGWLPPANGDEQALRYLNGFDLFEITVRSDGTLSETRLVANLSDLLARTMNTAPMPDRRLLISLKSEDERDPSELNAILNFSSELE
jgi:serine/threonine-protein kinase